MHAVKIPCYSIEQYLALESRSEQRHEYSNGEITAMTGASLAHNLIAGNLFSALREHLRGTPCRVYMSDVKVHIESANSFFYPNVLVSCVEPEKLQDCYF
jgi:Uma2 family endonuclease